jgi:hypothetical protein
VNGCSGTYSGEISTSSSSLPHGNGTFSCSAFSYTGEWADGKRHGRGADTYSNGDSHAGR